MKRLRSGWCETGHCSRCPELLQVADGRRREIHCDCDCHRREATVLSTARSFSNGSPPVEREAQIMLDKEVDS